MKSPFSEPVDDELVQIAKAGDTRAHKALYSLFGVAAFNLARRLLGDRAMAEDVVQETFIEVINNIKAFRDEAPVGMWIRRIAVTKSLMHLRSYWFRYRRGFWNGIGLPPDESAMDERPDLVTDLDRALEQLSPVSRAVVWLHDVEGYTHREIARLMERTDSFSKSQLARAHQRLRELLETEEGACTPVSSNS